MGTNKPTWGTGTFLSTLLVIFWYLGAAAQTTQQIEAIRLSYDQSQIKTLISQFKKERALKEVGLKEAYLKEQWGKNTQQLDGTVVALHDIGTDGALLYYSTQLDPTSKVSRANALYTNGSLELDLSGAGMQVGVWDAGTARATHQEFDSRIQIADGGALDNHGTLVTGAIVASGVKEKAKGVAFAATALNHDWSRDKIEVAEAAANGLLLSNHSYGIQTDRVPDWYFGAYIRVSQDWDNIMHLAPYYLMVTAAGNAQNSFDNESPISGRTQDGYDLLLGFSTSKNGLVVAGANADVDSKGNITQAKVAGYSSFGPIDDGRIKPDLAGDGTLVHTTSATSDDSYTSSMGTSMAAPGVTGSLLLLQEYHQNLYGSFMKAATLKGLALHTADDVQEEGPDYKMGWGVLNTKKAAQVLQNKEFSSMVSEETLQEGETIRFSVMANGEEPVVASISWTDPAGTTINRGDLNSQTAALINDLDIRISQNGRSYLPWKLNPAQAAQAASKGDNTVDPYERINIPNAQGEYTITISHKGGLLEGAQDFSLIVSGVALTNCQLFPPEELSITTALEEGPRLEWDAAGSDSLYEIQWKSTSDTNWTMASSWDAFFPLEEFEFGVDYEMRVRTVCSQNLASDFSETISFLYQGTDTVVETYAPFTVEEALSIKVYPNPVVNELAIEATLSPDAQYSIITTTGVTIKSGAVDERLNVADLATGLYVLTVQDYAGISSAKFFKE